MKKFTHAMAKFVLLQITVLSLTAERLPLTWFCAQGSQRDVQRPCTCQMQYTNVGQCAQYKLFTGEMYRAACQYHMCNLMCLSSFQFSYQDRITVIIFTRHGCTSIHVVFFLTFCLSVLRFFLVFLCMNPFSWENAETHISYIKIYIFIKKINKSFQIAKIT